jgi:hypothetical protein
MKISLKHLRKIIREELEKAHVEPLDDKSLEKNDVVTVLSPDGTAEIGSVIGRHSSDSDENAVWTVKTDNGTFQKKASEIQKLSKNEATAISGRSTMLHGSEDHEENDDDLLIDITEADEKAEQKEFTKRHYDFIAKQIVFNWRDRRPEVSWKAIADNFARGLRSTTGKILDVEKLYDSIESCLGEDDAYEMQWQRHKEMIGV